MIVYMKLMQFCIMVFIAGSSSQWTPNPYVGGLAALLAVFGITVFMGDLLRFYRWLLPALKRLNH